MSAKPKRAPFDNPFLDGAIPIDDAGLIARVEASYSADLFDVETRPHAECRTPVKIDGALWIMTSGYYGHADASAQLYRLTPSNEGLTLNQATDAHYATATPYYKGLCVIAPDGMRYVLDGERRSYRWRT